MTRARGEPRRFDGLRFDGRVAIVTGAGGNPSLGRAYAHFLAARGAKVVVNDLGVGPDGRGIQRAHADVVAQEIVEAGGEAIADTNSVAEERSAKALVETALDAYGRIEILINNAGVVVLALFDEISARDIERIVNVHLLGSIWMCRAVWPHMQKQRYGRIVNITSGAWLGMQHVVIYGAAKAGVIGLTRGLAVEGAQYDIKANVLGPAAGTIASRHLNEDSEWLRMMMTGFKPEQVAPVVAYLAHEQCVVSGKYFEAGGGRVVERFFSETKGISKSDLSIEDVHVDFDSIIDRQETTILPDPQREQGPAIVPKPYQPA